MKFPPPHRDSAERYLLRAHKLAPTDSAGATALASLATAHAVLAHLDALKADLDRSGVTSGSDDHAQTIETPAPVAPGATNTGSLEYLDQPAVSSRVSSGNLRAALREIASPAIEGFIDAEIEPAPEGVGNALTRTSAGLLTDVVAEAFVDAGWQPPLPGAPRMFVDGDTVPGGMVTFNAQGCVIQAPHDWTVVDGPVWEQAIPSPEERRAFERPAPQVFFPGELIPRGAEVQAMGGTVIRWDDDDKPVPGYWGPLVGRPFPIGKEAWQAAVDRARAEREETGRA